MAPEIYDEVYDEKVDIYRWALLTSEVAAGL
jgi:hypothetical protein